MTTWVILALILSLTAPADAAWWFTYTLTDQTGAVVGEPNKERGPYESEQACKQRRDHFIALSQRPRIDARDPKNIKVLKPLNAEVLPCDPDRLDKMPR